MIKKNTKIIWRDGSNEMIDELKGGMPLSKGETISFRPEKSQEPLEYEVVDKKIDYILDGEDHIVNVTYTIEKKS